VEAGAELMLKTNDFVFHLQFATLQLGNLGIVGGGMRERIGEFILKGLMPGLEFRKMNIWGHAGLLLGVGA